MMVMMMKMTMTMTMTMMMMMMMMMMMDINDIIHPPNQTPPFHGPKYVGIPY